MKKRWQYFKLMCQEITSFSWKLWIWMLVKIVVEIGLPFAQLLLSAQVIRWLMTGMEINQYLIKLGIWMLGIALLSGMQFRLMLLFEKEEQFFRIEIMDKLIEKYVNSDYPLILSEAGQENRMSTWGIPVNMLMVEAGVDYAIDFCEGKITDRNDTAALQKAVDKVSDDYNAGDIVMSNYITEDDKELDNFYLLLAPYVDFSQPID